MTTVVSRPLMKLADEVWLATAILHRKHPDRADFSIDEIVQCVASSKELSLIRPVRTGFYVHVVQHCVANRPPNPGRYRMLFETAPGRRRLFRTGDSYDPAREGSKVLPNAEELPRQYRELISWYRSWDIAQTAQRLEQDPILALVGLGKHLWKGEDPDEYVRRLREGWE